MPCARHVLFAMAGGRGPHRAYWRFAVLKSQVVIVCPAVRDDNNGNWQTARRWQRMLQPDYRVHIVQHWPQASSGMDCNNDQAMLALHARRSAPSVAAWAQAYPGRGLAVVLTGTDLYQDILTDASAQASLQLAQRLVVLQECAPQSLPAPLHARTRVIFQSTTTRKMVDKSPRRLRAVMVGHLRDEKSPRTLMDAAHALAPTDNIRIDHIGSAMTPLWQAQAQATAQSCPHYHWWGALAHEQTRRRIQRAHVLVHTSRMEGGAHVVMEAVCSGTPVLASRVPGNVGMLGADYAGYFDWNDSAALVALLRRCRNPHDPLLAQLQKQCAARAPLFAAPAERASLLQLLQQLLQL